MINLEQFVNFLKSRGFLVVYRQHANGFVAFIRYDDMVAYIDPEQVPHAVEAVKDLVTLLGGRCENP